MSFEPNRNDTMHFDLTLNLQFDDGTSLDYTFQELTVSENPGKKSLSLKLGNPT